MLNEITFGQYFPGNSVLHRADPRTKLLFSIFYVVVLFFCKSAAAFAFALLYTVGLLMLSSLPVRAVLRSVKPLLFVILFTAVINLFWTAGETPIVSWGILHIYREGVIFAVFMAIRIILLVMGMSIILSYTTTPIAMTDGIEALLAPLARIGLPVHDFAMMMTIAMRFIPTLIEETGKIMDAQKARGADFESGGIVKKAKALIPVLVPLFVSAFKRADDLAIAMECRCYRGGAGRTKLKLLRFGGADVICVILAAVFLAGVLLCNVCLPYVTL